MEPQPLISIIIPIYKVEEYLRDCIDSVISQSYLNLEIILVDDGSPDNCGKICDEYKEKDSRVITIHKENGGLSDARNAALEICKGEYISFIDSDDIVHAQFIEMLYKTILKFDSDLSFCSVQKFFDKDDLKETTNQHLKPANYSTYSRAEIFDELIYKHRFQFEQIVAWNKLYKKSIWTSLRYPKGRIHEDQFVIHHIFNLCEKVVFIDRPLYIYRQRENSITYGTQSTKQILDKYDAYEDAKQFFKEQNIKHTILNERQKWVLWESSIIIKETKLIDIENLKNIITDDLSFKSKLKLLAKRYTPTIFDFICTITKPRLWRHKLRK